jgi:hypothetical protein
VISSHKFANSLQSKLGELILRVIWPVLRGFSRNVKQANCNPVPSWAKMAWQLSSNEGLVAIRAGDIIPD